MVCDAAETADWVVIEGPGSLMHPGFSGGTLGLLHGADPDLMVLCHDPERAVVKGFEREGLPIWALRACIPPYEDAATWCRPAGSPRARIVAVALNTSAFVEAEAMALINRAQAETGLPSADPVREGRAGADRLAAALLG